MTLSVLLVLLLPLVAGQAVGPSTDPPPPVLSPFHVTYITSEGPGTAGVTPLTQEAGVNQSLNALNVCI
jgi:hypothetical protein